ncbi:MAG TPA: Ig-like domain-containing protein, partial [Gemmatimonadaceae bacterium]
MADINGSFSPAYLAVGDRDSVSAKAFTKGYPSHIKFNSLQDPTSFTYHSSNASVLSVDSHGKVMALAPGTVTLTATCEGVSGDATVIVTPLAASLVVSPTLINAHVGDTVSVTVTAHDSLGTLVSGIVFFFSTDTTYWYAVG